MKHPSLQSEPQHLQSASFHGPGPLSALSHRCGLSSLMPGPGVHAVRWGSTGILGIHSDLLLPGWLLIPCCEGQGKGSLLLAVLTSVCLICVHLPQSPAAWLPSCPGCACLPWTLLSSLSFHGLKLLGCVVVGPLPQWYILALVPGPRTPL
jgi:hypothetical protein